MFIASLYNLKGGVGKTASCVNFAYMAAKDGYRTLLWDLDPQGAASFYYKAQTVAKKGMKKLIADEIDLKDAITATAYKGLDIIPADTSTRKMDVLLEGQNNAKKYFKTLLKQVSSVYDFVFIDCPPGFSNVADNIFHASDAILMPVIPTTLSLRTYEQVKAYLNDKEIADGKLMCFFTMVDSRKNMHTHIMQELYRDMRFFEHYVPYLSDVEKMGVKQAPVEVFAPTGQAAICYRALWTEIKEGVLE